jgi:hypothetical protein
MPEFTDFFTTDDSDFRPLPPDIALRTDDDEDWDDDDEEWEEEDDEDDWDDDEDEDDWEDDEEG